MARLSSLQKYREKTFRVIQPLTSLSEAVQFVQERGALFFWPIKELVFPSLWVAVAGDRPVPNEHDDPAQITWDWKDTMLDKKIWYYAKILRKRSTILSLDIAPFFYALSENYGDPEGDYLFAYRQGKLSSEAKRIYEAILEFGKLDTIQLKQKSHLASPEHESRFNTALAALQSDFKIVPVGIADAGPWHYAFIYDLTSRQYPEIIEKARWISPQIARQEIMVNYFKSMGYSNMDWIQKLFQWNPLDISKTIDKLIENQFLQKQTFPELPGGWIVLSEIG